MFQKGALYHDADHIILATNRVDVLQLEGFAKTTITAYDFNSVHISHLGSGHQLTATLLCHVKGEWRIAGEKVAGLLHAFVTHMEETMPSGHQLIHDVPVISRGEKEKSSCNFPISLSCHCSLAVRRVHLQSDDEMDAGELSLGNLSRRAQRHYNILGPEASQGAQNFSISHIPSHTPYNPLRPERPRRPVPCCLQF